MWKFLFGLLITASLSADTLRKAPLKVAYSEQQLEGMKKIHHIIVIFQENWSFDSLYGLFPGANGLNNGPFKPQLDLQNNPYTILPPCIDTCNKKPYPQIPPSLPNSPFNLLPFIPMSQRTGDLVHAFYQEKEQINDGNMNKFAALSNAKGFVMSYYDISKTRIGKISKEYTLCDRWFHSCYGCSMDNALWLFTARMPTWPNAPKHLTAVLSPEGTLLKDGLASPDGYAINDAEPFYPPYRKGTKASHRVPPQTYPTIGDRLSEKGISWGWYAQGWDQALRANPSTNFPCHHQAPSYFTQFAPGTEARNTHLVDLNTFYTELDADTLPSVCFIRSLLSNSQHPQDSTLLTGLDWSADLIERIQKSPVWKDSVIILSYDENGGRWDHVAPPLVDAFGPGTRVPTLIISPFAKRGFVDSTDYETVSILKFIEERWNLEPLSTRDAQANNILNAFDF